MDNSIWITVGGWLVTLAICLINNYFSQKNFSEKHSAQMEDMIAHNEEAIAIMQTTIDNLRAEVEKHNQIVERVFVLEGRAEKFCTITDHTQKDIADLKKSVDRLRDNIH